ncbi:MAG: hypothetical protein M0Q90_01510 [Bacteroidales bacterium]|nr:hypothetical protein [Bacteroidales bacterium]
MKRNFEKLIQIYGFLICSDGFFGFSFLFKRMFGGLILVDNGLQGWHLIAQDAV